MFAIKPIEPRPPHLLAVHPKEGVFWTVPVLAVCEKSTRLPKSWLAGLRPVNK